jgi:hypothetical protein
MKRTNTGRREGSTWIHVGYEEGRAPSLTDSGGFRTIRDQVSRDEAYKKFGPAFSWM